jgi:tetratricopeptide (TPR) repeat protein
MQNTEELYKKGVAHLDNKEWQDAINCFIETIRQDATHTPAIAGLQRAQKQQKLGVLYAQGEKHLADKNWLAAVEAFSEIIDLDDSYKDAQKKLEQAKRFGALEALYEEGIRYFRAEEWQKAIDALEKVKQADVGYDVSAQLGEARRRKRLEGLYEEGMAYMRREKWAEALDKLDEVHRLDPNYRDVAVNREEARKQQDQEVKLSALYGEATGYERVKKWEEAKKIYLLILEIDSTYEDVAKRVEKVGREIKWQNSGGSTGCSVPTWWLHLSTEVRIGLLGILVTALVTICAAFISSPLIEPIVASFRTPMPSTLIVPFTPTLTEMLTSTVISSPTHTSTITLTSTSSPTVTPLSPYPAPVLVSSDEGTSFPAGQDVKLQWEWERDLAEDEFFEPRIRLKGEQEFDQMDLTKLPYQIVPASELTQTGTYEWQVAIVSLSGDEKGVSRIWSFELH